MSNASRLKDVFEKLLDTTLTAAKVKTFGEGILTQMNIDVSDPELSDEERAGMVLEDMTSVYRGRFIVGQGMLKEQANQSVVDAAKETAASDFS